MICDSTRRGPWFVARGSDTGLGIEIRDRVTQLDEHDLPDAPEPIVSVRPPGLTLSTTLCLDSSSKADRTPAYTWPRTADPRWASSFAG